MMNTMDLNETFFEKLGGLKEKLEVMSKYGRDLRQERHHLQEKVKIHVKEIEELQTKLFEANAEIMVLKNNPNANMNLKRNSIFAEVDDHRKKTKEHMDVKTIFLQETKGLKKDISDIAQKFKKMQRMFVNGNNSLKEELLWQIGQQKQKNINLRERILWLEAKLSQAAEDHGAAWTAELNEYWDTQMTKLEINNKTVLQEKMQLAEEVHVMQQDIFKWKYKCLKYRCDLLEKDLLLKEYEIKYPDISDIPISPSMQVDINNLDDTLEHQWVPPAILAKKFPSFTIYVDESLSEIPAEDKENIPSSTANIFNNKHGDSPKERKHVLTGRLCPKLSTHGLCS
ncbi:uncharacterized protein LOC129797606 isoform X2 [Lutzomyia longipalpis]|uniref:uncharacterized protein LOC129797606 isoform X2 n=1 Tax=Lutzomyia longipalpis TaxID=7200 RepID=UPI0024833876|nr:uncharacterized protein LOC129797606 isoform X2 [Lutzomyia longipalpis]